VQEYNRKSKQQPIDLTQLNARYQTQKVSNELTTQLTGALPPKPDFTNPIPRDRVADYQIADTIRSEVQALRETSKKAAASVEPPSGARGMLATAGKLTQKTDAASIESAVSDLWRSADKVVLIGPESRTPLLDGPKLAKEGDERLKSLPEEQRLNASDSERGERTKVFLREFAEADTQLTQEQKEAFTNLLNTLEPTDWNSNANAKKWGSAFHAANKELPPNQKLPESFFKKLRVLSQDFSTGLFNHATRLKHTTVERQDGLIFREETANKRFEYHMRADGGLKVRIKQDYQALCKHEDWPWEQGDAIHAADFSLTGIYDFNPDVSPKEASYTSHDLTFNQEAISTVAQRDQKVQESSSKAA